MLNIVIYVWILKSVFKKEESLVMKLLNKNYLNSYLKQIKDGEINNNFYHKRNFVL